MNDKVRLDQSFRTHSHLFIRSAALLLTIICFVIAGIWIAITKEVSFWCNEATQTYGGSCQNALISLVEDDSRPYGDRNSAIWTLGRLRAAEALPFLKSLYTGHIPEREPWNEMLSQHEMKKAIDRMQ